MTSIFKDVWKGLRCYLGLCFIPLQTPAVVGSEKSLLSVTLLPRAGKERQINGEVFDFMQKSDNWFCTNCYDELGSRPNLNIIDGKWWGSPNSKAASPQLSGNTNAWQALDANGLDIGVDSPLQFSPVFWSISKPGIKCSSASPLPLDVVCSVRAAAGPAANNRPSVHIHYSWLAL